MLYETLMFNLVDAVEGIFVGKDKSWVKKAAKKVEMIWINIINLNTSIIAFLNTSSM